MSLLKPALCFVLLLFQFPVWAQDCSFKGDNGVTDSIYMVSEKVTLAKRIKNKRGNRLGDFYFVFTRDRDQYLLTLGYKTSESMIFLDAAKGDKMLLQFENNETLALPVSGAMSSMKENMMSTSYSSDFLLEKDQLKKLEKNKIVNIRIVASANSVAFDIEKNNALNVQAMARCMLL